MKSFTLLGGGGSILASRNGGEKRCGRGTDNAPKIAQKYGDKNVIMYQKVISNEALGRLRTEFLWGRIVNKKVLQTTECSSRQLIERMAGAVEES